MISHGGLQKLLVGQNTPILDIVHKVVHKRQQYLPIATPLVSLPFLGHGEVEAHSVATLQQERHK